MTLFRYLRHLSLDEQVRPMPNLNLLLRMSMKLKPQNFHCKEKQKLLFRIVHKQTGCIETE